MWPVGILLIALGAVYLRWPLLFRRGIWLRTSIAIRLLPENAYKIYMYVWGGVFIAAGVMVIVLDFDPRWSLF
jgi:hypothetical protein